MPSGGDPDTYDVVGHWNRHRGAFMPVLAPFQTNDRPILKVTHWAELTVPRGVQLRNFSQEVERYGPAGFDQTCRLLTCGPQSGRTSAPINPHLVQTVPPLRLCDDDDGGGDEHADRSDKHVGQCVLLAGP